MSFFSVEHDSIHTGIDQLKRIKSALNLKMDSVNADNQTGKIKNYDVTLDKCTCTDFGRRHKPCKHMYCLAMELGIFNSGDEKNLEKSITSRDSFGEFLRGRISRQMGIYFFKTCALNKKAPA